MKNFLRARQALGILVGIGLFGCSSIMKYEKEDSLQTNKEFAEAVKIQAADDTTSPAAALPQAPTQTQTATASGSTSKKGTAPAVSAPPKIAKKTSGKKKSAVAARAGEKAAAPSRRPPDLEDIDGFIPGQRRPLVDPFRVGEVVTHRVSYFKLTAGDVKFKIEPFQKVNGRKAYTFATELRTASIFASIYTVDDRVVTLVDFEDLAPRVFTLHVKESGQLREARSYFDNDKLRATYWEKKVTKKSGEEEKKLDWEILPYSQNVFSAIYYMRFFKWETGKEYSFRVADDEQNLVFKGTAVRREEITIPAGTFKSVVVKPIILLKGAFKPIGDIYIWLSDDEHHYVLKIESEIKIGTLRSEAISIEPGTAP